MTVRNLLLLTGDRERITRGVRLGRTQALCRVETCSRTKVECLRRAVHTE